MSSSRINYNSAGRPVSITYTHPYNPLTRSQTSVTVPIGYPSPFANFNEPERAREPPRSYHGGPDLTFPRIYQPSNEEDRAHCSSGPDQRGYSYNYLNGQSSYTYSHTYTNSSSSSSSNSGPHTHQYTRTYTSTSPLPRTPSPSPPPRATPSLLLPFYSYEDEEPEKIAIKPAKWNNFRSEATKEELINYSVWRGMDRKRAERLVGRVFEGEAPRWLGNGDGGKKFESAAGERRGWEGDGW